MLRVGLFLCAMLNGVAAYAWGTLLSQMPTYVGSPSYAGTFSNNSESAKLTIWRQTVDGKSHLFVQVSPATNPFFFCPGGAQFSVIQDGKDYGEEFSVTRGDNNSICDDLTTTGIFLVDQWELNTSFDESKAFTLQYSSPSAYQSGSIAVAAAGSTGGDTGTVPATYDVATNQLTIPTITLAGTAYNNLVVTVRSFISANTGTPGATVTYDTATGILSVPGLVASGVTYTNVKLTISAVVSVGSQTLDTTISITPYTEPSAYGSVATLSSISNSKGEQITFWGLKDATGNPLALTESLLKDPTTGVETRTFYGSHGFPMKVTKSTGETTVIRWGTANAEFRFYDANRRFVMGRSLATNSSGSVTATTLSNDGLFAGVSLDDLIGSYSPDMLKLAASNCRDISKSLVIGGSKVTSVCLLLDGTVPAICAAGVAMVGAGLVANLVAHQIDHGGTQLDASKLNADLADPANTEVARFSRGWNSGSLPSGAGAPTVIKSTAQYASNDSPSIKVADSALMQAALTPTCSSYQTLKNGQCVNNLICDAYQKEQNGVCVPNCTTAQEIVNGVCVTKCASNQVRQNGVCVAATPTCTSSQELVNNQCLAKCVSPQVRQGTTCVTPVVTLTDTWVITDKCDDGYRIDYKFYDTTANLVWPSSTSSYSTPGYNSAASSRLSCTAGDKICFGGTTGSTYWGVGVSNTSSCTNCCYTCDGGTHSYSPSCSSSPNVGSGGHSLAGKTMYAVSPSGNRFATWTFYSGGSGVYSKPQTGSPAQTNAPFNWTYNDTTGRFVITNSHGTDTGSSVITLVWQSASSGYADEAGWGTLFTFTLQ